MVLSYRVGGGLGGSLRSADEIPSLASDDTEGVEDLQTQGMTW